MKNRIAILVVVFLATTMVNAQIGSKKFKDQLNFTPDQIATLQTKRMALNLDLDKNQQEAIFNLKKEQAITRQAMRKAMLEQKLNGTSPTSEEIFQLKSSRLDRMQQNKIAMQKILNQEQFSKWQTTRKGIITKKQGCANFQRKGQQKFKRQS
ncbi:hypothetical protein [Lutibacter sp.]